MPASLTKTLDRHLRFLQKLLRDHDEFFIADPECALPACLIRPLTEADFEACEEIYRLNEEAHFPPDYFGRFQKTLRGTDTYFLVAEVDGAIRAFGGMFIQQHPFADCAMLAFGMVHPAFHKRGFGTALLLARLASLPRPKSHWVIAISTTGTTGGSQGFYSRFGFTFAARYTPQETTVELEGYYVKVPRVRQLECRQLLDSASVRLESRSADIPRKALTALESAELASAGKAVTVGTTPVYSPWTLKTVGAVIGCFGLGFGLLVLRIVKDLIVGVSPADFTRLFGLGMLMALTLFCLNIGVRLLLLRPNSSGSTMGSFGWYILGTSFGLLGVATCIRSIIDASYIGALVMPILVLPFAWTCILLGLQVARRERLGEQVNPAKPSVTGADTADRSATANLAPGSGMIEFFNDDATPMEFVVNVLSDYLQLDRQAAIQHMLGIHHTGSVLIPCASYVDAARIVALISARAREAGHPLRCQVAMHP